MKSGREDARRVLILGAGIGGTAVLEILHEEDMAEVVGIADSNPEARGLVLARKLGIPVFTDISTAVEACKPCTAFNVTGDETVEKIAGKALGAGSVIGGLEAKLIVRMVDQMRKSREQLLYEANHDPLTGLYNRRHIQNVLDNLLSQAARYGTPLSIVLLDLDLFKPINDTHGHPAGDAVLKSCTQMLRNHIRDADIIGRWGGEEFIVLLPHTDNAAALIAARHWLDVVCSTPIHLPDGQEIHISFSAGVASYKSCNDQAPMEKRIEDLLHRTDQLLYQAKREGRKRACGESS